MLARSGKSSVKPGVMQLRGTFAAMAQHIAVKASSGMCGLWDPAISEECSWRLLQRAVRQGSAAQRRVASLLLVAFKERQSQLEPSTQRLRAPWPRFVLSHFRLLQLRGASLESFDFQKHLRYSMDATKGPRAHANPCARATAPNPRRPGSQNHSVTAQ